jgi:hypothetical protein
MRRVSLIALFCCIVTAAPAHAAPASLEGETFVQGGPGDPGGIQVTNYQCNPAGTSSASFSAAGTATGPYPGTFTETGTVTWGPVQGLPNTNNVTSFQAQFTISSPNGTVTGTKSLVTNPPPSTAGAVCFPDEGKVAILESALTYQASISSPAGNGTDQGTTHVQFGMCPDPQSCGTIGGIAGNAFREDFVLSQPLPAAQCSDGIDNDGDGFVDYPADPGCTSASDTTESPDPVPTSTEQCKKNGWRNYPTLKFKTQGDCESYVKTHSRNPPNPR